MRAISRLVSKRCVPRWRMPRSAPPSTDIYNQSIPSSGYGYLTTRDGTKLAVDIYRPTKAKVLHKGRLPAVWQPKRYEVLLGAVREG